MRIVMIHALAESVPPVRVAFKEVFPEAEVINLLDEGLFIDFEGQITPKLRRRVSQLICYCEEYRADAIGLACSVYAPGGGNGPRPDGYSGGVLLQPGNGRGGPAGQPHRHHRLRPRNPAGFRLLPAPHRRRAGPVY